MNDKAREARTKQKLPDCVVGSAGQEVFGFPVDIETPDCSDVAVVGSEPFAVDGVPHVRLTILRTREQEIALTIVLDLKHLSAN